MPLFEYECRDCKTRFEHLILDRSANVTCRACGSSNVAQLLSTFAVGGSSGNADSQRNPCQGCPGMQNGSCGGQ